MNLKFWCALSLFILYSVIGYAQEKNGLLYSFTIVRRINNNNNEVGAKYIKVDSLGNVYNGDTRVNNINICTFSNNLNNYLNMENLDKHPGNNDIAFVEVPSPKLNEQVVLITIKFLDDFYKEKNLRNKTYYSWGKTLDKSIIDYPIFKYLDSMEINTFKNLLK